MTRTTIVEEQHLDELRGLIEQRSGIRFDQSRERFFSTRVREHVETKGLERAADLLPLVSSSNVEYEAFLQCLLTHETSFFRYPSSYEALKRLVLPEVHAKKRWASKRTLRLWSAGCSTGEEPYSIAITVAETPGFAAGWNIEILATDVSRQAVGRATQGIYSRRALASLTPQQIGAHFNPADDKFAIKPVLRKSVNFHVMNLVQCPYLGRMDCIFCMNVLIYFSGEHRDQVVRCFYDSLEPGGYLMLGHSESISNLEMNFEKIVFGDFLLYRKPGGRP